MNWKTLCIGFAAGAACMMTTSVLGAYTQVRATLVHDALFNINDNLVASPSDMPALNYNGYTYVPLRFVAEELDCKVNWNAANRQVLVIGPKKEVVEKIVEKPVEKIVYVDKNDAEGNRVYSTLPAKESMKDYKVTMKTLIMDDDEDYTGIRYSKVYLNIENLDAEKVQIDQLDATLTLDGEEFQMARKDSVWDDTWDNEYVKEDEDMDGYLIFDGVKKDYSTGTLKFRVRVSEDGNRTDFVEINFKNDK